MIRNLLLKLMALVFVFGVTAAPAMADSDKRDRDDYKPYKHDKKDHDKKKHGDDEDDDKDKYDEQGDEDDPPRY